MKVVISNGQLAPPATATIGRDGGEVDDATVGVDVEESEVKVEVAVGANVDVDVEVVVVVVTMGDVVCGIVFVDIVVVVVV